MFDQNGIPVSFLSLKSLFRMVGENPGSITLDEFKKFSLSENAKSSKWIIRIQGNNELNNILSSTY